MSVKARMANNSENWARIEYTKSKLGKSPQDEEQRKKLTNIYQQLQNEYARKNM